MNWVKKIKRKANCFLKRSEDQVDLKYAVGENCTIEECVIGDHCAIGAGSYLYKVSIGNFSYLSISVYMMNTSIGKFCSIAQGVCVGLGDHPSAAFVSTHPAFFSPFKQCGYTFTNESYFPEMGNNIIGNDVWIGANAIILNNVNIGNGAIIGAGAVVTKDVPDYAIVAGVPAKIIRYRFDKQDIDKLSQIKWWERDISWIEANYKKFHNIRDFINFLEH